MTQQLRTTTDGLVELDSAEMMSIDGGSFAYWLGAALGVIAVVAIVILLL